MWLVTMVVWGSIAFIIVSYTLNLSTSSRTGAIVWIVVAVLLYYILVLCSSNFRYFMGQTDASKIYEEMDQMFKSPPHIVMNIVCYHYETRTTHTHHKGHTSTSTHTVRVVTHTASQDFVYRSWRDISGLFRLDTSEAAKDESMAFVKLELSTDITFSNDGTADDFNEARERFKAANRRDRFQDYSESFTIEGFKSNFMVQVTDVVPCCIKPAYFLFWSLLTFYSLYMMYVDQYCAKQKFAVRKVVSSRQDLNAGEMQRQLTYYNPRILTRKQTIVFNPSQPPQYIPMMPSAVGPDGTMLVPMGEPPAPGMVYFVAPSPAPPMAQPGPDGNPVVDPSNVSVPTAGYMPQPAMAVPAANYPQQNMYYGYPPNGILRNKISPNRTAATASSGRAAGSVHDSN